MTAAILQMDEEENIFLRIWGLSDWESIAMVIREFILRGDNPIFLFS